MKRILCSTRAKCAAIVLLMLSVAVCCLSLFGVFTMIEHRVYSDQGKALQEHVAKKLLREDIDYIESLLQFDPLRDYTVDRSEEIKKELDPWSDQNDSNFRYTVLDSKKNTLYQNAELTDKTALLNVAIKGCRSTPPQIISGTVQTVEAARQFYQRTLSELDDQMNVYDVKWNWNSDHDSLEVVINCYETQRYYVLAAVQDPVVCHDKYYYGQILSQFLLRHKITLVITAVLSLAAIMLLLIFLICAAGRRKGCEEIRENVTDRIPFDLFLLIIAAGWNVSRMLLSNTYLTRNFYLPEYLVYLLAYIAVMMLHTGLLLWLVLSFATRCKTGHLLHNTLLARFGKKLILSLRFVENRLPVIWLGVLVFAVVALVEFLALIFANRQTRYIFWVLEKLLLAPIYIQLLLNLNTLEQGSRKLNDGNYEARINPKHMLAPLRRLAENLNGISLGMKTVLDKNTKSERMKAELITNVSHDIKTPLTSIINYVNLLQQDDLTPEQTEDYLRVLDRQSTRLKKLIVDLVEASKAATGNTVVESEPTDINLLLTQAAGEYEDRMSAHALQLSYDLTPQSPMIQADPKLLWRVFDNLLNNALKYSQPATRVYLSTRIIGSEVEAIFRNVSSQPLNIPPEELMERFVRGDSSGNTDGSGLGLAIAQSLTELMKGVFQVDIDGDLFKVTLRFVLMDVE